jgi:chromate transporter
MSDASPYAVPWREALKFWLKLGFISFGGPAGQIAIMQRELVEEKRWISQGRFNHALNYCMLLPGPEAQQLATYLGWLLHRNWGGIVAGTLFVLPSFFMLIFLSWLYVSYGTVPQVAAVLWGVQCAVAAIVVHALVRVAKKTLPFSDAFSGQKNDQKQLIARILIALSAMSFVAIEFLNIPFPWIIGSAALIGWLASRIAPEGWASGGGHGSVARAGQAALIDDHTPTPAHARFDKGRLIRVLLVGVLLWVVPMALLVASMGWASSLTRMGLFFSQAALVTFGGAYAVLPYVAQTAQDSGWLTPQQMMVGLALGESTPGPLIMVNAFVGYVGQALEAQRMGSGAMLIGASMFIMGCLGALVATWFTFLPSFVFILAGGPFVESTHGKLGFTAPLKAITAAVVGVIASLAVLFMAHAWWPRGLQGGLDVAALIFSVVCAALLFARDWSVLKLIAVSCVAGFCVKMLLA